MRRILTVLSLAIILLLASTAAAQKPDAIVGKWLVEEKDTQIEIYSCEGKFCGKIIWLKDLNYPADDPKGMAGKAQSGPGKPRGRQKGEPYPGDESRVGVHALGGKSMGGWLYLQPPGGKDIQVQIDPGKSRSTESSRIHRNLPDRENQYVEPGKINSQIFQIMI
jgi:hypothetical protein